jgi:hypothetical protein
MNRTETVPTVRLPVHQAIDRVTAILLEVQSLQRQLDEAHIIHHDHYRALLTRISTDLHRLGAALTDERDHPRATPPPRPPGQAPA